MSGPAPLFTVLVNSCDRFEDCWNPFFTLFSKHWPHCAAPILLNTESKQYQHMGLNIDCTSVQGDAGLRLTWSECLLAAIQQVTTPLVLYLQEDYFIGRPVNVSLIEEMARLMSAEPAIKHIGLTEFGSVGPFILTPDPRLCEISHRSRYLISTQAGLWRTKTLASNLRPWENGWMFEIFGTRRARRRRERFLTVNRDIYNSQTTPVIDYLHTGIIKGRWHCGIREVFERHGIRVDLERRGFYRPVLPLTRKLDLLRKVVAHPVDLAKSIFG